MGKLIIFMIILSGYYSFSHAQQGIWSNSFNISNNSGFSHNQDLQINRTNNIHLVWQDASRLGGTTGDILYSCYNTISWSAPVAISSLNMAYSWDPAIALDSNNKPHVVWEDNAYVNGHIFYANRDSNMIWSAPLDLSPFTNDNWNPDLAIDAMNNINVVWKVGLYYLFYRKWDGQQWQAAVNLWPSAVMRGAPKIASDSRGYLHLVWEENAGATDNMMYSYNDGNGWSDPVIISNVPGEHASDPSLCIDENDNPHVVWRQTLPYIQGEVFYSNYTGVNWTTPLNISNLGGRCYSPVIAISPFLSMVTFDYSPQVGNSCLEYVFLTDSGWSNPDTIAIQPNNTACTVAMDFDNLDHLQMVRTQRMWTTNTDLFHQTFINQPDQLPTTLTPHNPPITIPAAGGNFHFDASVSNQAVLGAVVDVWFDVRLPNGNIYGPLLNRQNINMAAHATISRTNLTQNIPGSAPAGLYYYRLHAGDYPSLSVSVDSFAFTKSGAGTQDSGFRDWELEGWEGDNQLETANIHPSSFSLHPCTPNPFNPTTVLSFELRVPNQVSLKVYDTAGRLVTTLVNGWREAGSHKVTFDGSSLASGVYLYVLTAGEYHATGKMVLLK